MTYFDRLPLEVIRHVLFPYLDYEGRVGVNTCLPRRDYIRTQLKFKNVLVFHMFFMSRIVKVYMDKLEVEHDTKRRRKIILKLLKCIDNFPILLQYHKGFRETFIAKLGEYSNPNGDNYRIGTRYFNINVEKICKNFTERLNTDIVYIGELSIKGVKDNGISMIHPSYISVKPEKKRFV